jgi:uroporphyrinogen-III synthase
MRVLILRPEPQASAMAAELAAAGHDPVVAPMLTIEPEAGAAAAVRDGGPMPQAIVFTSPAAVDALGRDDPLADLLAVPVIAVGTGTAGAARRAGFVAVLSADGDAAAAVDLVGRRFVPEGGRIVHVAGRDRAADVAGDLAARGFSASTVVAYRAETATTLDPALAADLAAGRIDAVVVASRRTAEAFRRSLESVGLTGPLEKPVAVAISQACAEPLAPLFRRRVVAERPDGASLTKAVVALPAGVANNDPGPAPGAG